jgi:hypothetical protein
MSRSFHCSVESSVTVQEIHTAFCERDYWLARLAAAGGAADLDSFDVGTDSCVRVVIVQGVRNNLLPKPFGRLYPLGLEVVQEQTWMLGRDARICGEVRTEARGARGSGLGTLVMAQTRDGARLKCTGIFDFKVPLVGGQLENYFGRQMVDQTPELVRFTTKWVDEHA